jgi:tetratricopeptide (TPR) repeat protein
VDARSSRNLWGEQYDRKMSDLVSVQQEISGAIAAHLREHLSGPSAAVATMAHGGTGNADAYQLYLKGMYYWEKRSPESLQKAKDYFQQAIDKDPNYAMAYTGLASYYYVVPDYAPISNSEALPKARAAAEKALQIDNTLAEPHAILGGVLNASFEWNAAESEFRRALELSPNDAHTYGWYAFLLDQEGRFSEGIAIAKRAVELEPLNLKYGDTLAAVYRDSRQYDLALEQSKHTLEMDPNYTSAVHNLALMYRDMQKYDLWLEEWKKGATINNDHEDLAIAEDTAAVYAKAGYTAALKHLVELQLQLAKRRYVDPADIGFNYAELGEKDEAFTWLDKAYAEQSDLMVWVKVVRPMDGLRSDPRYAALLKKMNLTP